MRLFDIDGQHGTKVNEENMALTHAMFRSEIEYYSAEKGDGYTITTDNYTFNSTAPHPWLYIENREQVYNMFFDSMIYSFNGGDTNHDRTLIKRLYRNPPAPTANMVEKTPTNLNFGSVRVPSINVWTWDGSATDGMEIDTSNAKNTLTSTVQAGTLVLSDVEGIVLPFGTSVLISFEPEEIGMSSISAKILFKKRT